MSGQPKLRSGTSELTSLKKLWRDSLGETARDYWRELFVSQTKQSEIRKQIFTKLKINLIRDEQLDSFRKWEEDQRKREAQEERTLENERRIMEAHPDWTLDQVREETLKQAYFEALATGNYKLGLATAKVNLKEKDQAFEETKFKEALRTKLQAGLDVVAEAFKKNPAAMKFYQEARELILRETQ